MNTAASPAIMASNQSCTVRSLYRVWLAYAAGIVVFATGASWIALALWATVVPIAKWLQIRFYPRLSPLFGYGLVDDDRRVAAQRSLVEVTLYQALGCPFCPIVLSRLQALQKDMGFSLRLVNVTLQPRLLAARGIKSVPAVLVGDRCLVGNATSRQLAELIAA